MNLTPTQLANTKRLIAALRSGKYQRTEGRLRTADGYCPWGIACDLYDPTRWLDHDDEGYQYCDSPDEPDSAEFYSPTEDVALAYGDLTRALFTRADLARVLPDRFLVLPDRFLPEATPPDHAWSLIELNDNLHLTLSETADVLEELFLTGNYRGRLDKEEREPYDYAADDFAFDAAREQRFK